MFSIQLICHYFLQRQQCYVKHCLSVTENVDSISVTAPTTMQLTGLNVASTSVAVLNRFPRFAPFIKLLPYMVQLLRLSFLVTFCHFCAAILLTVPNCKLDLYTSYMFYKKSHNTQCENSVSLLWHHAQVRSMNIYESTG